MKTRSLPVNILRKKSPKKARFNFFQKLLNLIFNFLIKHIYLLNQFKKIVFNLVNR